MAYTFNDHRIVFFNQYRQLCVFKDNAPNNNPIQETLVLLQTTGTAQRFVSICKNTTGNGFALSCSSSAPSSALYTPVPYDFLDNAGDIWLGKMVTESGVSVPAIVIGTGDIRDGATARVDWYPLPDSGATADNLIIECTSPYQITIHYKMITPDDSSVPKSTISCGN